LKATVLAHALRPSKYSADSSKDSVKEKKGIADTTIDCDGGTADTAHVDSHNPATVGCESVGP
jgi:hypothetical protein